MRQHSVGLGWFAREILGTPLYPYQEMVGNAILDSVLSGAGHTFTVMFARQMGKNQLSAVLEAYLLSCMDEGTVVKAAPTFKPQVLTSRLRLLSLLDNPLTQHRVWTAHGYMIGVAPSAQARERQQGPRVLFFSADPEAHVVGATASLLLEVDEAQDVAFEKYNRDLRPMAATTGSTTVLYGTAWSEETLLAMGRAHNLDLQMRDGTQRHFEFDWRTLAAINPDYRRFVEREIEQLGEEHVTIRTQYRLLPITGAGYLFTELQRYLLKGNHDWEQRPPEEGGGMYVAGMDIGGEERLQEVGEKRRERRDSTVITIGRVHFNELHLPSLQIVHQAWWTGLPYQEQYAQTLALAEQWGLRKLVIDRNGLGEGLSSLLLARLGEERLVPFTFTRPSKSRLTYHVLSLVNSGRLKMYRQNRAPLAISNECWKQLTLARYSIPAEHTLNMYVETSAGHDDFLMSLALCCEALNAITSSIQPSLIVKPRRLYADEGVF